MSPGIGWTNPAFLAPEKPRCGARAEGEWPLVHHVADHICGFPPGHRGEHICTFAADGCRYRWTASDLNEEGRP